MQLPSLAQVLLPLLLASQEVASLQLQPAAGGAAIARRYAGAVAGMAIPAMGNPAVGAEVNMEARQEEGADGHKKKKTKPTFSYKSKPTPKPTGKGKAPFPTGKSK